MTSPMKTNLSFISKLLEPGVWPNVINLSALLIFQMCAGSLFLILSFLIETCVDTLQQYYRTGDSARVFGTHL
jgi:hypothetical protein